MTDHQWNDLLAAIEGKPLPRPPIGFIIDSPWLPNWFGADILDYFTSEDLWFEANRKAIETFPEIIFLPGFWSEFGMCTEPSAFGAKCVFPRNEFPFADKVIHEVAQIDDLQQPNPATDGLLPFMLNRLKGTRPRIEAMGHQIRFSVSRGPLNIATFLMGATEFLSEMMMHPDEIHVLVDKITRFLKSWLALQLETIPTLDGILLLDDIIGFMGRDQFREFGFPSFKTLFDFPVSVKFLHNDALCAESLEFLPEMGVNLFNMAYDTDLNQLKRATGGTITMLGNIPPRDVLADGTPGDVRKAVRALVDGLEDRSRVILSVGGAVPGGVPTANIRAFIDEARRRGD
jgi:uroporphyrinogen decarboxylase